MKANLLKSWNDMVLCELETPVAGPGEAVIRMHYAGVCGSDISVYTGSHPTATAPVVIGHEILGTIVEVEPDSGFHVGDRVTVNPLISCGICEACRKGHSHVCKSLKLLGIHVNGGYAEYVKASVDKLVKVPDTLSDRLAALAEPFAVGAHVTARSGIQPGQTALVIGAGPIGDIVALCAMERGAKVIVSEPNEIRRNLAAELGIATINPMGCDIQAELGKLTDGNGFDVVYEASGSKAGILMSTEVCKIRGTIVPLALSGVPVEFILGRVSLKELSVIGSRVYTAEHFREGLALLTTISAKRNLDKLVSDILPLNKANTAIDMMRTGKNSGKILIDCHVNL